MPFKKYMHIERLGTEEVEGILDGTVYVFPKIDGTNTSVWLEDGQICCATHSRKLGSADSGWIHFWDYVHQHEGVAKFFGKYPECRLYGEWLIPHTVKTYHKDAWNKFYVFDVYVGDRPISYLTYQPWLEEFGIEYIPCTAEVKHGTDEIFTKLLDQNTYLIQEGAGIGEGIVIKRYDFVNRFGRITWAKRVTNAFKYGHVKTMGAPTLMGGAVIEEVIVNQFVTLDLVNKEFDRICTEKGDWNRTWIPMLFGCVYHTFITEELWHALKKYPRHPVIDFRVLNRLCTVKIKELKPELF